MPKITCQQKKENLSIHAKIFMPTKNLIPYQQKFLMTKESMTQKKKNQCPTKILSQLKLFTCVNQKFLHVQSNQKLLHVQSQQKIPTRPKS